MRIKTIAVRLIARVLEFLVLTARKTLSVSASRQTRLFLSSPYICVNKVFICDLLRVRFRVSESCGLQVINQLLMLWLSQLSSVKVGECPTFHA